MQNKPVTYEFSVIRLVPRVEREEFLNIGVILFSKRKRYLDMKYHLDEQRIKAFAPAVDLDLIKEYLKGWELVCRGGRQGGKIGEADMPYRFRWLTANRSTILQSARPHSGLCVEPQETLERLFVKYVL